MDLTLYYQKIRDEERKITEEFPVVISNETGDGGRPGHPTEVQKLVAARLIVQGSARLATVDEARAFRAIQSEALRNVEELATAARVHLSVVPTADLERLKSAAKSRE